MFIANYTPKVQYERLWTPTLLECRGLIISESGEILARPFPKFFNVGELEGLSISIPDSEFEVYEKVDGSLGILYWDGDTPKIATRGSFTSDQAIEATRMLSQYDLTPCYANRDKTFLFEIVYPENRVVVNYGDLRHLVFLGCRTLDGNDVTDWRNLCPGGMISATIYDYADWRTIPTNLTHGEGFVIKFSNGFRMKIKMEDYLRIHYVRSQLTDTAVWNNLSTGVSLSLLDIPDEFADWYRTTETRLKEQYEDIYQQAVSLYMRHRDAIQSGQRTRKDVALELLENHKSLASIVFRMLDEKSYADQIWSMIKPSNVTSYGEISE